MRRLAAVFLMFTLTACGGGGGGDDLVQPDATVPPLSATAPPLDGTSPPSKPDITRNGTSLRSCDGTEVRLPTTLSGLDPAGTFARLDALRQPLKVRGRIWSDNDERMYVGVVCGVSTPERFATLVAGSRLTAYQGKPALRWTTRTGVRNFMWLDRPGTAVYIGTTPGLAGEIKPVADYITAR